MRKYFSCLLLLSFIVVSAQSSKDEARQKIWDLLNTYHTDSQHFMSELYSMPLKYKQANMTFSSSKPGDFMVYVNDYSEAGLLSGIGTVVHESSHSYSSKRIYPALIEKNISIDFDQRYTVYFIKKGQEFLVRHTPTFPSRKMANEIRGDLRSFRWDTYIQTNQDLLSTQQHGVYGLMNEWTAYYNGMKTIVGGFEAYKKITNGDPSAYRLFLEDAGSIKISYPEFKFYILHYLEYASRKEKKIYREVINNVDFKEAFKAIDFAFANVIASYDQRIVEVGVEAKEAGLSFDIDSQGFLFIGNQGVGTYTKENEAFLAAINSTKYQNVLKDLGR